MQHQSFEVLEQGQVGEGGNAVAGEVEVLEVHVLAEVLNGLDVVVGEAEPGKQVDVLQALNTHKVVGRQVKHLEKWVHEQIEDNRRFQK